MSTQRFSVGKRFMWARSDGCATCTATGGVATPFEITRILPGGGVQLEQLLTGGVIQTTHSDLVKALFEGCLAFEVPGKCAKPASKTKPADALIQTQPQHNDLVSVPDHLMAIARRRLEIISPLMQLPVHERTRQRVHAHVAALQQQNQSSSAGLATSLSPASVYRWMRDYAQSDHDLRALIPNTGVRGGKAQGRIYPEVEALLQTVLREKCGSPENVTAADVWHELAVRIRESNQSLARTEQLGLPSLKTIERRIQALDLQTQFAAKHGARMAKRAFAQYDHIQSPLLPLERVEIDHTRLDLIVVDDRDGLPLGRPTLTHCFDYTTRYPLGYYIGFEPPSWYAVMECLYHAICPKSGLRERFGLQHDWLAYGVPINLIVDNGKEFIGKDLKDACVLLGIVLETAPVRTPEFKAGVERMFGTMNTGLVHGIPGTTFSNPEQRGDYDALTHACVSLSDFEQMFNTFITDIYAQRFHRGLNGIPARHWNQAIESGFNPRVPSSKEELLILLGRVQTRTVQHYGVELEGLHYNDAVLAPLRHALKGEPTRVKYHPGDLSRIHVYDPFQQNYLTISAVNEDYAHGLSLWKHRVIKAYAQSELGHVDLVALGEAKRRLKDIVTAAKQRKRINTRQRIARYESGSQPPSQQKALPGTDMPESTISAQVNADSDLATLGNADDWEIVTDTQRQLLPVSSMSRNAQTNREDMR